MGYAGLGGLARVLCSLFPCEPVQTLYCGAQFPGGRVMVRQRLNVLGLASNRFRHVVLIKFGVEDFIQ